MLLFFGLGNNESKYLLTRHNVGRLVVEYLAEDLKLNLAKQFDFYFAKSLLEADSVGLLYSAGYMNLSGEPLSNFLKYYKIPVEELSLVIIQDDSDQTTGNIKLVQGGGSGGHHGIGSIYKHLSGLKLDQSNIWRLKIGIRPVNNQLRSEHFVLHNLTENEINLVKAISKQIVKLLPLWIKGDTSRIQNELNTKLK